MRAIILALLLVMPVSAQVAPALYMTDEAAGSDRLLSPDAPSGDGATLQFSPAAAQPANTYTWVTGSPAADDIAFTGEATIDLYFDSGLDASSTSTVTLLAVGDSERELGSASDATPGQAAAHQETFAIDLAGETLLEGEVLALRVSITDLAVLVQLRYGGADTPSGITTLPYEILDSDGDGIGDSAERRAGTDPMDATDPSGDDGNTTTGDTDTGAAGDQTDQPAGGSDGTSNDADGEAADRPIEVLLAAFFLLLCLALAGIALLGRFPA